jgi:hypothetical protein
MKEDDIVSDRGLNFPKSKWYKNHYFGVSSISSGSASFIEEENSYWISYSINKGNSLPSKPIILEFIII